MEKKIENFGGILNDIKVKKSVEILLSINKEVKSNINITYSFKKDNKKMQFLYIISKIDLINIIKKNNNNNLALINKDSDEDIIQTILYEINEKNNNSYSIFSDYLMRIEYFDNKILVFNEIFFNDNNRYLSQISEIYKGEKMQGYGFIIKESATHLHFIMKNEDNILDSSIYKDYSIIPNIENNNNIKNYNYINEHIEKYFKDYLLSIPNYKIGGIFGYTEIKIICLDYFKLLPLKIKIITDDKEKIFNTCENEDKIIFILRYKKHISILLKVNKDLISFDTSFKHLRKYENEILKEKTKYELTSFKKNLQNTGSCSFYSIKILELISKTDIQKVKDNFRNGNLLLELIKEMAELFLLNNNKVLFSDKKNRLNSENEIISITHNNKEYFIDKNFHINKFVIIKNFLLNLNKDISQELKNLIENQKILHLINVSQKKVSILKYNYSIFNDFFKKIDKNKAIELIENSINNWRRNEDFDKDNLDEFEKFSKYISEKITNSENNNLTFNFLLDKSIKFNIINYSLLFKESTFDQIKEYYSKNVNEIRFLFCLGDFFNEYCKQEKLKIVFSSLKDEEEAQFIYTFS